MAAASVSDSIPFADSLGLAFLFLGIALFAGVAALTHTRERAGSTAIVYLVLGVLAGIVVRSTGLGRLAQPVHDHLVLERVTDGALILGLFATGMRIRRTLTLPAWRLPLRLVAVQIPASTALVALWARDLAGIGTGAAIALGAALTPTDPVLAGDLGIDPPRAEQEERSSEPEFVLTAEAGLNDGFTLPFLLLGFAVARHESLWRWAGTRLVYGIVVALVVGAALGRLIAWIAVRLRETELFSSDYDRWIGLASAFAIYGAAEALGSFGFVAAFAGGVAFRRHELADDYHRDVHDGADVLKHFSELAVILILGSMLAFYGFSEAGAWGLGLAAASVFAIRPVTAFLVLARSRLSVRERIWVAWFGVKGVASLNYVAVAVAAHAFGADVPGLVWTVLTAVALSVVVHGVSSTPLTRLLLRDEDDEQGPDRDPTDGVGRRGLGGAWTGAAAGTGRPRLPARGS
ncbi:MAG TPA: cation:proton antiporter [Gaiellaceae bacterium]|nr:cation:proton antiporter [Gaiellaceae bacterium]